MFIEIVFDAKDLAAAGFDGRDELEDPLAAALESAGLAEVTGGGSGAGAANIDIEANEGVTFEQVLGAIRAKLQELKAPRSTFVKREGANERYRVYPE